MTNEEAQVTLRVNSSQARQDFEELEKKAEHLRGALAAAFRSGDARSIREVNQELQRTERQMTNMRTNAANIRAAMERLDQSTPKQLKKVIADINRELNSGRVQRGSREWDEYTRSIRRAREQLQSLQAEQRATEGMFTRLNRRFNDWGASLAASAAAFAGVVMGGKEAVQAYADMEAEEANVSKYSGLAREQVAALNEEFKAMDTRTSREQLNRLAQEAGRLGKTSQEDVLGYVRAADKINVALDDLGEGATLTLSKLTGIFGIEAEYGTEEALLRTGSVVNDLSQNCSAAAPYLVEFASRLGGVAAQSHMAVDQVLSFAAVLDTQNLNVEASATVMTQLITDMYKQPAKVAKAAGMDVKEFANLVKTDMNGALIALFEQLNKQGGMESLAKIFTDMGTDGARAQPVLAALAGHVEELKNQQLAANQAFKDGTSINNEFAVQNNTVQAQLDKAKKKFHEVAVELGEKLLPVMKYAVSGSSMLLRVMSTLVSFFLKYKTVILATVAAVAAYRAGLILTTLEKKAYYMWTKRSTEATLLETIGIKAQSVLMTGYRGGLLLVNAAKALFTGNVLKAGAAMRAFNLVVRLNPLGLLLSVISAVVVALGLLDDKEDESIQKLKEAKRRTDEFRNSISNLGEKTTQYAANEIRNLDNLYTAATNHYKSMDKRIEAVKELQRQYPAYFGNMTTEAILAGQAYDKYVALAKSIRDVARARAAQDQITENEKTRLGLEMDSEDAADQLIELEKQYDRLLKLESKYSTANRKGLKGAANNLRAVKKQLGETIAKMDELDNKRASNSDKIRDINSTNDRLAKKYSEVDTSKFDKLSTDIPLASVPSPEGNKDKPSTAEARLEAENRAKEILAAQEEAIKEAADFEQTVNTMSWSAGFKNYEEFVNRRSEIDRDAVVKRMALLEKTGLTETEAYKSLAKQREKIVAEGEKKATAASLHEIERRRKEAEQDAVKDFNNPESDAYQDKALLNTRLLDLDVEYLTSRRDLYEQGSEEWVAANDELLDRLAKDQADKQKQLSDNYLRIRKDYLESDADREKMELAVLDQVHAAGLLSEEEYQKAIQAIKDKYRDKNKEDASKVSSEYGDLIKNLYTSFSDLFKNAGKGGQDFWDSLASAAQGAYAVISSVLSSFSAYSDASRDLELAKVEKRYDREIQAAGNNEKKKEELEKRKEAETAKIKKKYNDRSMKMQMAQALAQTAMAAISAYASALAIGPAGLVLAPIAAAMAVAAGMMQVATIKKQHDAQQEGYYDGGFTRRDPDSRREVGVVHANEFVANSRAVANPSIAPVLRLIDYAQRNNTVASLTAEDVSEALGLGVRVSARGMAARHGGASSQPDSAAPSQPDVMSAATVATLSQLNRRLEEGIPAYVVMDGEQGLYKKLDRYKKLIEKPAR